MPTYLVRGEFSTKVEAYDEDDAIENVLSKLDNIEVQTEANVEAEEIDE